MQHRTRVLAAAMASVLVLSLSVSHASANRLSFSEASIYLTWDSFQIVPSVGGSIQCAVTYLGSIHNTTIEKVRGALIGWITHVAASSCEGGSVAFLRETLPWHITYQSFFGRLPFIFDVRKLYVGMSIAVTPEEFGVTCLARTSLAEPAAADMALDGSGRVTGSEFASELAIDTNDVGAGTLCDLFGVDARLEGTASVEDARAGPYAIQLI
jgi:hypothetical protein